MMVEGQGELGQSVFLPVVSSLLSDVSQLVHEHRRAYRRHTFAHILHVCLHWWAKPGAWCSICTALMLFDCRTHAVQFPVRPQRRHAVGSHWIVRHLQLLHDTQTPRICAGRSATRVVCQVLPEWNQPDEKGEGLTCFHQVNVQRFRAFS